MDLLEVSLRASWDYPFIELSRAVSNTPISMWCIWDRELLQVPSRDPAVLRRVERAIRTTGHVVDEWADASAARMFLLKCTCDHLTSPWNLIFDHKCWESPPIVYQDGWVNLRVMSFGSENLRHLMTALRKLGPAELVRKRRLPLDVLPTGVYANVLFGGLTAKQAEALLTAFRLGYYTSPRQVTTEVIASSLEVSRTTYDEHLRKAENRVIAALVPYLQLFATANHRAEELPLGGSIPPRPFLGHPMTSPSARPRDARSPRRPAAAFRAGTTRSLAS